MPDAALDAEVLQPLFATPPPEFVAARNALVKRLRADKQRDAATLLSKVRRPGWVDWALNAVAVADAELVERFADAAEVLREAQAASIEGRDGPDLRGALRALRDATTALGRRAGGVLSAAGRAPDTAEVAARLGEVAAQPDAVVQLRAGVLGSAEPGDEDLFTGLVPARPARPAAPARRAAPAGRRDKKATEDDEAREREVERQQAEAAAEAAAAVAARDAERAAERERLEAALAEAEAERDRRVADVDEAQAALDASRTALKEAQAALKDAAARLRRAR